MNAVEMTKLAVLSDGKVFLVEQGKPPVAHESRFAKEAEARADRNRRTNEWKEETDSWDMQSAMNPGLSQFQTAAQPQAPTRFTNVARGKGNTLCYSLNVFGAGGLFTYDLEQGFETRLMHQNSFRPVGLSANPEDGSLAFGVGAEDGTLHVKVMKLERPHHRQLTDGDTCDEAPSWHFVDGKAYLYFHSTGVGRSEAGYAVGRGPGQICRIGLEEGNVETLISDESLDFLQPKLDDEGNLYAIRRRYELPAQRTAPGMMTLLKDLALLPYRLFRVGFYFANFMSMMFVGKPLTSDHLGTVPK